MEPRTNRAGSTSQVLARSIDRWIAELDRGEPKDTPPSSANATSSATAERTAAHGFAHFHEGESFVAIQRVGADWQHAGSLSWTSALSAVDDATELDISDVDIQALSFVGQWFGQPADAVICREASVSVGTWCANAEQLARLLATVKAKETHVFESRLARHGLDVDGDELRALDTERGVWLSGRPAMRLVSRTPRLVAALVELARTPACTHAQLLLAKRRLDAADPPHGSSARLRAAWAYSLLMAPPTTKYLFAAALAPATERSEAGSLRHLAASLLDAQESEVARDVFLIVSTPELQSRESHGRDKKSEAESVP